MQYYYDYGLDDKKHYTTRWANSADWDYIFTFGGRSNGKTTGWQLSLIDDFFDKGHIYGRIVRKYTFDPIKNMMWFNDLVKNYVKERYNHEIVINKFNFYMRPLDENERYLEKEKGQRVARYNDKLFMMTFNLALENDDKSHDFEYLNGLLFEEFSLIDESGYLPEEVMHFESLVSTIVRQNTNKKFRFIFIGNTIRKNNPYFDEFGIDLRKLKLKIGDKKIIVDKGYKDGARFAIELIPSAAENIEDIPRCLRISGNEIAISGDFVESAAIFHADNDDFIKSCISRLNFAIRTNNKVYYHYTAQYKSSVFNVLTSRHTSKAKGKIFDYDLSTIENIKAGNLTLKDIVLLLREDATFLNDTIFSDDDIEYKYNMIMKKTHR